MRRVWSALADLCHFDQEARVPVGAILAHWSDSDAAGVLRPPAMGVRLCYR